MGRIADRLRPAGGDELVACADLLDGARQHDGRRIAWPIESRGAEINRFIRERLLGIGIDQRSTASKDIPGFFLGSAHASHIGCVPCGEDHAIGFRADDGRRFVEAIGLDDERSAQERLDDRRRNLRR